MKKQKVMKGVNSFELHCRITPRVTRQSQNRIRVASRLAPAPHARYKHPVALKNGTIGFGSPNQPPRRKPQLSHQVCGFILRATNFRWLGWEGLGPAGFLQEIALSFTLVLTTPHVEVGRLVSLRNLWKPLTAKFSRALAKFPNTSTLNGAVEPLLEEMASEAYFTEALFQKVSGSEGQRDEEVYALRQVGAKLGWMADLACHRLRSMSCMRDGRVEDWLFTPLCNRMLGEGAQR